MRTCISVPAAIVALHIASGRRPGLPRRKALHTSQASAGRAAIQTTPSESKTDGHPGRSPPRKPGCNS